LQLKIKLGDFLHQQLKLGQFHRYAWQVLRGKLKSSLAKRLYIFLDAQRGNDTTAGWLYEVLVNNELYVSLGVRDRNLSRARTRLREACVALLVADPSYKELGYLRELAHRESGRRAHVGFKSPRMKTNEHVLAVQRNNPDGHHRRVPMPAWECESRPQFSSKIEDTCASIHRHQVASDHIRVPAHLRVCSIPRPEVVVKLHIPSSRHRPPNRSGMPGQCRTQPDATT
jgi:hypothetical protein